MEQSTKRGRPRRYDLQPLPGFRSEFVAYAVAAIDELCERLYDLIADLPQQAMDYVPEGATNTIAMLALHMAWAEASWVAQIAHVPPPPGWEERLQLGRQGPSGELPPSSASAEELVDICQRVRRDFTRRALASLQDIDVPIPDAHRPMTARGVLMHLIWHWTYHSGQIGLLRRQWGARYQWTFDRQIGSLP